MTSPIVIKKYENRRLYDTKGSRYVNLDGVAEMVRSGEDIQVIDSKTGEDVTRHVLTQIIVDGARDPDRGTAGRVPPRPGAGPRSGRPRLLPVVPQERRRGLRARERDDEKQPLRARPVLDAAMGSTHDRRADACTDDPPGRGRVSAPDKAAKAARTPRPRPHPELDVGDRVRLREAEAARTPRARPHRPRQRRIRLPQRSRKRVEEPPGPNSTS